MAGVLPDTVMGQRVDAKAMARVNPGTCLHLKTQTPGLRFEWHPLAEIVFVIRMGPLTDDGKEIAEPFAWGIENEGQAWNAALIWLRGYRHASLALEVGHSQEQKERSPYVDHG